MTVINATLISYFIYCKRRLWFHANGIRMEHSSDIVAEGKLIGETTYQQRSLKYTEVELSYQLTEQILLTCKIDFYDAKDNIVHEVKKSDSKEVGHEWQVRFYLWVLQLNGINNSTGIIEYPKFREIKEVFLTDADVAELRNMVVEIQNVITIDSVPSKIQLKFCKNCSYYELCYIDE
jgi:CRISPR-associated exonuclease Cas4